ncbi:MAG: CAP domain-containing protein [Phycisphaerae bacterium]|nr:CAP domain-containing protein [Phycisphaerae bacterium]
MNAGRWTAWCALCGMAACTAIVGCSPAGTINVPGVPSGSTPGGLTDNPDTAGGNSGMIGTTCESVGRPASAVHLNMLSALNAYRAASGLTVLAYSKTLEAAANAHARDLYVRNFFDHTNPDGDGPLDRAEAAGFCNARSVAENIAAGQLSVAEVQTAWEQSPGHNANMINPDLEYVGMGYYLDPIGRPYWVQLFGSTWN